MSQSIPSTIKARIQKLLALANDDRGNENEAAAASAKVQALLAEYNLEMSQVQETTDAPDAGRETAEYDDVIVHDWQVDLMSRIAQNNFCLHVTRADYNTAPPTRRHSLIGRGINVLTTRQVYDYLNASMNRLNPFTDRRRVKARRSWFEGCAERLSTRLYEQRGRSEMESRQARKDGPRGNGSDLILSEVYSSEDDLNRDFRWGYAPGTTARQRAESMAKWEAGRAEREAGYRRADAERDAARARETPDQRKRREASEAKEQAQGNKRWDRERRQVSKLRDHDAYAMGDNTGRHIGLNAQVATGCMKENHYQDRSCAAQSISQKTIK